MKPKKKVRNIYLVHKNGVNLLLSNYARLLRLENTPQILFEKVTVSEDDYLRTAQVFCKYSNKHLKEKVLPWQPGGGRVQPGLDTIGGSLCSDNGSSWEEIPRCPGN